MCWYLFSTVSSMHQILYLIAFLNPINHLELAQMSDKIMKYSNVFNIPLPQNSNCWAFLFCFSRDTFKSCCSAKQALQINCHVKQNQAWKPPPAEWLTRLNKQLTGQIIHVNGTENENRDLQCIWQRGGYPHPVDGAKFICVSLFGRASKTEHIGNTWELFALFTLQGFMNSRLAQKLNRPQWLRQRREREHVRWNDWLQSERNHCANAALVAKVQLRVVPVNDR